MNTDAKEPREEQEIPETEAVMEDLPKLKDLNWEEPSEDLKQSWREEFGEGRVKRIGFPSLVPGTENLEDDQGVPIQPKKMRFVYRCLSRSEYNELVYGPAALDPDERSMEICQRCILWPTGIDFRNHFPDTQEKAGTPAMLVEYIMEASGFVPADEVGNV